MSTPQSKRSEIATMLFPQYGCGPIRFSGKNDAMFESIVYPSHLDAIVAQARPSVDSAMGSSA